MTFASPQVAAQNSATAACTMSPSDRAWLQRSLESWRIAERGELLLPPSTLPVVVAIDANCTFIGQPNVVGRLTWIGVPHGPVVTLPNGAAAPVGPISFAAPDGGGAASGFFAMSLPSVWRASGVTSGLGLERLMEAVLLHELSHTRQFYCVNPEMERLGKLYGLPDDIGDDSLQTAYAQNTDYVADYQAERDLLFAAAAAPTNAEARRLAGQALGKLRARRAKWFAGPEVRWTPLDDLFLTMEGLAQWTAYAWLTDPKGGGLAPEFVLPELRRGGQQWTQDEGLALFLTIDRLTPGWQHLAFADRPAFAEALLEEASRSMAPGAPGKRAPAAAFIPVPTK